MTSQLLSPHTHTHTLFAGLMGLTVCVPEAPVCRPTPLYGQPSWWGEEDYGSKVHSSEDPRAGENIYLRLC